MKEEDKNFIENYYMLKSNEYAKKIEEDFDKNVEEFFEETKNKKKFLKKIN